MFKKMLMFSIVFILFGCQQGKNEWNPIFEETHFDYINAGIERSLLLIDDAYAEAGKNRQPSIQEKLYQAKNGLLEIKDYYLPLTTVRQKIYDAERYCKLKNLKKSAELLEDSKSILTSLDVTTRSESFDKVILDLNAMINEVIATFDEKSTQNTYQKMKRLGEHINLMLYRGDLVLSGVTFEK